MQLSKLEKETKGNSKNIENIFAVLMELIEKQNKPVPPRNPIGFKTNISKNDKIEMKVKKAARNKIPIKNNTIILKTNNFAVEKNFF